MHNLIHQVYFFVCLPNGRCVNTATQNCHWILITLYFFSIQCCFAVNTLSDTIFSVTFHPVKSVSGAIFIVIILISFVENDLYSTRFLYIMYIFSHASDPSKFSFLAVFFKCSSHFYSEQTTYSAYKDQALSNIRLTWALHMRRQS